MLAGGGRAAAAAALLGVAVALAAQIVAVVVVLLGARCIWLQLHVLRLVLAEVAHRGLAVRGHAVARAAVLLVP